MDGTIEGADQVREMTARIRRVYVLWQELYSEA